MTTMDFFGNQEQARKATRRFIWLFAFAVLAMVTLIYFAVVSVVQFDDRPEGWWRPEIFAITTLGTLAIITCASFFKVKQLKSGGPYVAALLGGKWVDPSTDDLQQQTLRNVVEEMAIASGVPVPAVFVLEDETSINAFAAGWGQTDAAIAVTRGTLERLNRDELQGVIAHEFSHVFHGDMRLNIRLMGVLFGIVCITTLGEIIVRSVGTGGRRRGGKDGNAAAALIAFGIALWIIGSLGVLFSRLIKAAISRQREYLADASAVQFTRNPRGIGMALAKIGGFESRVKNAHAEEVSHMFIANGVTSWFGGMWSTHPPIEQRVERILPGFRRELLKGQDMPAAAAAQAPPAMAGAAAAFSGVAAAAAGRGHTPESVMASIGQPTAAHVENARALLAEIPLELHAATRGTALAQALCCALLLDKNPDRRRAQIDLLQQRAGPALSHEAARLHGELQHVQSRLWQPLLELSVPTLRLLTVEQQQALREHLRALAEADEVITPIELMLLKYMERFLPRPDELADRRRLRTKPLLALADDTATVLSVLAHWGSPGNLDQAAKAFAEGAKALQPVSEHLKLRPASECDPRMLDAALVRLDEASPLAKRQILLACARAVGTDGVVQPDEGVLLRAVAAAWGCPLPPIWNPQGALVG